MSPDVKTTIAAIATPKGSGGIGVVRVSGPKVSLVMQEILGTNLPPRLAKLQDFLSASGTTIDSGIAIFFPGPNSFTGEDVLELQGHGGVFVLDKLLARTLELGCEMAAPGEFTERAFINDKLDLLQAEAVLGLINARSMEAANAALRTLKGDFSQLIFNLNERIINLRLHVEAQIDFSDEEDVTPLTDAKVATEINGLKEEINQILKACKQGSILTDGITAAILGKPNAGKSSLMNILVADEAAIVSDTAGTTRDAIRRDITLGGVSINLTDTAGVRDTTCSIEQEGIKRAWQAVATAELVLVIVDGSETASHCPFELFPQLKNYTSCKIVVIQNKADIMGLKPEISKFPGYSLVRLSAKTRAGVDLLEKELLSIIGLTATNEGCFMARRRHLESLNATLRQIDTAYQQMQSGQGFDLLAEELHGAQMSLSSITGEFNSDDLLGRIFQEFCIGK